MVPNDAVLRWPRLYWGRAAKTHTYTHTRTAADTTSMQMQTNTDWGPTAGLIMRVAHMQSIHCTCNGSMHPVIPDAVEWHCADCRKPLFFSAQTTEGIQLQCCLDTQKVQQSNLRAGVNTQITGTLFFKVALKSENNKNSDVCSVPLSKILRFCSSTTALGILLPSV